MLSFSEGAQLGFESGFYGLLAAIGIYDLNWQLFHYQLWKIENADRVVGILGGMVRDAFSPSTWIVITLQIILNAIFAGVFGAPSGILGVKIFQRKAG